ncbi:unnamed protein product [Ceutorhynchus assimilis]|uniref:Large ribosomal subunit protein bL35m n=1 Tax=Ceutorhynchus assimilis TaxID=467358 RepID=A0A9N9MQF0_9CUCU|nr:unnamed protein product [Ceutorhynchus assimilis]
MIQWAISLARNVSRLPIPRAPLLQNGVAQPKLVPSTFQRYFSLLQSKVSGPLVNNPTFNAVPITNIRTITKYSMRKGKRKTCSAVTARFYRLNWGIWIRRIAGCNKKLWKKSPPRRRRLRQHVFCNSTQSYMLDKMVNNFWRRPKYYVDDPYEPYHRREEYKFTYRTPKPYFPPEQSE